MKYTVTIDDKIYAIEINSEGEIITDGERYAVDFQSITGLPVVSLILDGQSYDAYVNTADTGLEVLLRGQRYLVTVEDERQRQLRDVSRTKTTPGGEIQIKAPMPGLIVAVPVEEGLEVGTGDNLVVLESMKMQNELKAPRACTVASVRVEPGENVEQNQVLVIIK